MTWCKKDVRIFCNNYSLFLSVIVIIIIGSSGRNNNNSSSIAAAQLPSSSLLLMPLSTFRPQRFKYLFIRENSILFSRKIPAIYRLRKKTTSTCKARISTSSACLVMDVFYYLMPASRIPTLSSFNLSFFITFFLLSSFHCRYDLVFLGKLFDFHLVSLMTSLSSTNLI